MPAERGARSLQIVALIAIAATLPLMWMRMAFDAFAGAAWYDPVVFSGLFINVAAQLVALRYLRKCAS